MLEDLHPELEHDRLLLKEESSLEVTTNLEINSSNQEHE